VRRLLLLLAAGTLWLFLAAIPTLADGGPHVQGKNSGMTGLTADGCAGCHRAHTAQGLGSTGDLLVVPEEQLCQSCHGPGALGATTNVWNGVQFDMGATAKDRNSGVIVGALRNGGFLTAAIGSGQAAHYSYSPDSAGNGTRFRPKVPANQVSSVLTGQTVTSAHLAVAGSTVSLTGKVWGNGTSVAATTATLDCASCHNPHGNGQYRILVPKPSVSGSGNFVPPAANAVVDDAAPAPANDTRNYTIIQTATGGGAAGANTWTTTSLLLSQAKTVSLNNNLAGDYMHRYVPWNATATNSYTFDGPNGKSGTFNAQITAWCLQCHTQYMSTSSAVSNGGTFNYRHSTNDQRGLSCVTCHVGHGSNAQMTGDYSSTAPYPDDNPSATRDLSASSRLLKIDNRGTCQACHDPTHSSPASAYYPAAPVPLTP
jgi:predicted CXXCH cytochrome family protein